MYLEVRSRTAQKSLFSIALFYSRRKKEEGRRKKEEAVIAMVSAIKNVLTVLAVAIYQFRQSGRNDIKSLLQKSGVKSNPATNK